MLAFNPSERIITYWDEPTITMDYESHDLHSIIHNNWVENRIPNIVLSCATLPKEEEIMETLADFRSKFEDAEIHTIASYDCRKSIPIITKDGFCGVPHTLYPNHKDLADCAAYVAENKTLLRYFDLGEIVGFLFYINGLGFIDDRYRMDQYFPDIASITMNSLKIYYLELLQQIPAESWPQIYSFMTTTKKPKFQKPLQKSVSVDSKPAAGSSGILITTSDAHTLTAGPTIFLSEDAKKIGTFYIQQSEIPQTMFQDILKKIDKNNKISAQLATLEYDLEALTQSDPDKKTKQKEKDEDLQSSTVKSLYRKIDELRGQIRMISLDAEYVPNTKPHQMKWAKSVDETAFCPNISEEAVKEIMSLPIDNTFKLLMLVGIGVFIRDIDAKYLELMKRLASMQDLFIIIASSDFVFGTNYNFCHGFIGKDMANMTQAKTIQCLGRIGRSAIQTTYTVRFRDDAFIYNLFKKPDVNLEAVNMSRLFSS